MVYLGSMVTENFRCTTEVRRSTEDHYGEGGIQPQNATYAWVSESVIGETYDKSALCMAVLLGHYLKKKSEDRKHSKYGYGGNGKDTLK